MSDGPLSYEPFFGLKKKPFSLASDPEFLYESPSHSAALLALLAGMRRREGLLAFTGDVGTGKTTICRAVLRNLDRTTFSAFIPDPFASREDLLRMLLIEFGVASVPDLTTGQLAQAGRAQLSYLLSTFLDTLVPLDAFVVVFIDEAQNMSLSLLEEVRVLSDAFSRHGQLQVVLVGQLELLGKLKSPAMRQVDQRVSVYTRLDPLSAEDVVGYVQHRLQIAGASPNRPMFAPMALNLLHEAAAGVPRVINRICDRALHLAYERRSPLIDRDLMIAALEHGTGGHRADVATSPSMPLPTGGEEIEALLDAAVPLPPPPAGKAETPAAFATKVDAWLSDLDGREAASAEDPVADEFSEIATSAKAPPHAPLPFEAPLRRRKSDRFLNRLGRRVATISAVALAALVALNVVAAAATYVPSHLGTTLEPRDFPPLPPAPEVLLRPIAMPAVDPPEMTGPAAATPQREVTTPAARHYVAVGAYSSTGRAERLVAMLTAADFAAFTRRVEVRGRALHQVWLGPFAQRQAADEELARLQASGDYSDARLLPLTPAADQTP